MQIIKGNIGGRIKRLRSLRNMTQEKFAERVGITQQYVGALELGNRTPSPGLLIAIAYKFRVSERWLRTGKAPFPK